MGASVKVHLLDGGLVLFPKGFRVHYCGDHSYIEGKGTSIRATQASAPLERLRIPLTAIFAIESYDGRFGEETVTRTLGGDRRSAQRVPYSSPQVFTHDGSAYVLEAEAFSNSLLRTIEADDLDRLDHGTAMDGTYTLRLANNALETHYVNQLDLVAVDHAGTLEAFPTRKQTVMLFGTPVPLRRVTSRDGRDVAARVRARDGMPYRTAETVVEALTQDITYDWVDVEVDAPTGAGQVYLALRIRNTGFNTALLDEALLAGRGFEALDLFSGERFRPLVMLRLYRWCRKNLGLWVQVGDAQGMETVDRIGGTGPAAWRQVGVVAPVLRAGPMRIRLLFLADSWMVDWVGVSFEGASHAAATEVPPARVERVPGVSSSTLAGQLRAEDDAYVVAYPGDTFRITYTRIPLPTAARRTYLVRSRGYFVKWIPAEILRLQDKPAPAFKPDNAVVRRAARRWLDRKHTLEDVLTER